MEESKMQLNDLANAMPQVVWIAESNGEVSYYNDRISEFAGARQGDNGKWKWEGILHPDDVQSTIDAWDQSVKEGVVYEKEHRIQMSSGGYRWHLSRAFPQRNEAGIISKWFGTATDIHHQKTVEEKLHYLAALSQSIADAVIGTDLEFRIVSWNPGAEMIYGWKKDEVIGKLITDFLETDFLFDNGYKESRTSLEKNGYWSGEVVQKRRNKEPVSILASISYVTDSTGKVVGAVGVNKEITEKKKAELEIERFKYMVENASDPFILMREDGGFAYLNKLALERWGYTEKESKTIRVPDVDPNYNDEVFLKVFSRAQKEKIPPFETIHKRKDGTTYPVEVNMGGLLLDGKPHMFAIARDITERKQAEETLRESEERFRGLADQSPMIVYIVEPDADATMSYFNKMWLDYTGQTIEEALGRAWNGIVHPDDFQNVLDIYTPAFNKREPYLLPSVRLKRHDGQFRWHVFKGNPRYLPSGEFMGYVGVGFDIHERTLAEETLRESEERFRTLAETLPQLVWMTDEKGQQQYASSRWQEYTGIEPTGAESWGLIVHEDDLPLIGKSWMGSLANGVFYRAEARLKSKSGEYRWHFVHGEPIRNATGEIVKWIGSFTDIHDQKTIAEKLEALVAERTEELIKLNEILEEKNDNLINARYFLQTVLDSSVELVFAFDENLNYTFLNKKAEIFINKDISEVLGNSVTKVFPGIENTATYQHLLKALKGETVYIRERESYAQSGVILETYMIPLKNGNKVNGVTTLQRDVTSFVRLSEDLKQANIELERSNADLQQFAHVASHDLKEPVRKIKTFASRLIDEAGNLEFKQQNYLDKILSAADRMTTMIEGVLDYSTIDALDQKVELLSLNEIVREIQNDLEVLIQQKQAIVEYKDLPMIRGARVLIYQLFYNVINNSLKFSKNSESTAIEIVSQNIIKDDVAFDEIGISDNGIGFESEYAERIFSTFTRLNSKDNYEGTGLGLSLCKKIVERHNGKIKATSKLGVGTTITIWLPTIQHEKLI